MISLVLHDNKIVPTYATLVNTDQGLVVRFEDGREDIPLHKLPRGLTVDLMVSLRDSRCDALICGVLDVFDINGVRVGLVHVKDCHYYHSISESTPYRTQWLRRCEGLLDLTIQPCCDYDGVLAEMSKVLPFVNAASSVFMLYDPQQPVRPGDVWHQLMVHGFKRLRTAHIRTSGAVDMVPVSSPLQELEVDHIYPSMAQLTTLTSLVLYNSLGGFDADLLQLIFDNNPMLGHLSVICIRYPLLTMDLPPQLVSLKVDCELDRATFDTVHPGLRSLYVSGASAEYLDKLLATFPSIETLTVSVFSRHVSSSIRVTDIVQFLSGGRARVLTIWGYIPSLDRAFAFQSASALEEFRWMFGTGDNSHSAENVVRALQQRHGSTLRVLHVSAPLEIIAQFVSAFPNLRNLGANAPSEHSLQELPSIFRRSPRLEKITLIGCRAPREVHQTLERLIATENGVRRAQEEDGRAWNVVVQELIAAPRASRGVHAVPWFFHSIRNRVEAYLCCGACQIGIEYG